MPPAATPLATLDLAFQALSVLALAVVFVVAIRSVVFVGDEECHVLTDDDGDVERVLERGIHFTSPLEPTGRSVDTSPVAFEFAGGHTETEDGVEVRADVSGEIRIVDAAALVAGTRSYPRDVQRRIDEAYVTQVGYLPYDDLADDAATLEEACRRELEPALEAWGVELERFEVDHLERVD
jgi:regulator of protease activity HflC (stomatin/prohibitin superfamily)